MLKLENIHKKAGNFSLKNIDFTVDQGDYFVLIGKSGAGKSMILETIAGLLIPNKGDIQMNGQSILNTPIQQRNMGLVYQKPTLFPHMNVFDNIAYPLRIRKFTKKEIKTRVEQLAEQVEIQSVLNRNIGSLSGGELQRVTIARTLATNPKILLLDEPLSFLDVQLKRGLLTLLRKLHQQGQTIIHVTHDYEEALSLANRVAIIEQGQIIQTGTPEVVFKKPKSAFVANFIGMDNFFQGHVEPSGEYPGLLQMTVGETSILIPFSSSSQSKGYISIPGTAITLSEEKIQSSAVNNFKGVILEIFKTTTGSEVVVDIGIQLSARISDHSSDHLQLHHGKPIWVSFKANSVLSFDA